MTTRTRYLTLAAVGVIAVLAVSYLTSSQTDRDIGTPPGMLAASTARQIASARPGECREIGQLVARYLVSGDNEGLPGLDTGLAETYSRILAAPEEARDGLRRAAANRATVRCDERLDEATAQSAAAEVAAQETAGEEATRRHLAAEQARVQAEQDRRDNVAAAELEQASRKSCAAVGGRYGTDRGSPDCFTTSTDPDCNVGGPLWMSFRRDGSIDQADAMTYRSTYPGCFTY